MDLLDFSPRDATGNVGDAAASNSEFTSDDVVEVSNGSTGTAKVIVCQEHPNLLHLLWVELRGTIPRTEVPLRFPPDDFLGPYNSHCLWCWLLERGPGGCIKDPVLKLETKGYGRSVFDHRDCDLSIPGDH